jgi:hypothetical protein
MGQHDSRVRQPVVIPSLYFSVYVGARRTYPYIHCAVPEMQVRGLFLDAEDTEMNIRKHIILVQTAMLSEENNMKYSDCETATCATTVSRVAGVEAQ